jgi:hypothetical protein
MPAAAGGILANPIVPIIITVVVLGGILWWLFHTRYRLTVTPGGLSFIIPPPTLTSVSVTFDSAGTIFSAWTPVDATVTAAVPASGVGVATTSTPTATTTAASPTATITVVPIAAGSTTLYLTATATDGKGTANASLPIGVSSVPGS